ncbi:MAG TPA: hypothetical protein VFW94_15125 [Candidatus Acidoferrales bacterium]|nr:hypothetical protein [Candidatus Acidoferrales bacterium]
MGRELQTADEVIDALGGTAATARLTGKNPQHVSNWRAAERLPAETFLILQDELRARDLIAPPSLWGIREPERAP